MSKLSRQCRNNSKLCHHCCQNCQAAKETGTCHPGGCKNVKFVLFWELIPEFGNFFVSLPPKQRFALWQQEMKPQHHLWQFIQV